MKLIDKNKLLEEVWKKDELKFGYIYNNDPHETIETYKEVLNLMDCLHYNEKRKDINFDAIPQRYEKLVLDYKKMEAKWHKKIEIIYSGDAK